MSITLTPAITIKPILAAIGENKPLCLLSCLSSGTGDATGGTIAMVTSLVLPQFFFRPIFALARVISTSDVQCLVTIQKPTGTQFFFDQFVCKGRADGRANGGYAFDPRLLLKDESLWISIDAPNINAQAIYFTLLMEQWEGIGKYPHIIS